MYLFWFPSKGKFEKKNRNHLNVTLPITNNNKCTCPPVSTKPYSIPKMNSLIKEEKKSDHSNTGERKKKKINFLHKLLKYKHTKFLKSLRK